MAILEGVDEDVSFLTRIRVEAIHKEYSQQLPHGRSGNVMAEDLAATRYRILTGLPQLPCAGWRW